MRRWIALIYQLIQPFLVLALVFWALPRFIFFFLPFFLGALIAELANPMISFLHEKTRLMQRRHASSFILLLLLSLICLCLYLLVAGLMGAARSWADSLPGQLSWLKLQLSLLVQRYDELWLHMPEGVRSVGFDFIANLNQYLSELASRLASPTVHFSLGAVKTLPNVLVYTVVTIFTAFHFASDRNRLLLWLKERTPAGILRYLELLRRDIRKIVQDWLLAQFKLMFFVFLVLFVGFALLKLRYGVWLAAVTAFLDFLPMFGVGFVLWPWIVFELVRGQFLLAFWLLLLYLLTQAVRQIMQPKIMGDTMGMPPLWTIFFLYVGYKFYGLGGMIFSMPAGMLFLCFYRYGAFDGMLRAAKILRQELAKLLYNSQEDD